MYDTRVMMRGGGCPVFVSTCMYTLFFISVFQLSILAQKMCVLE